ncbi:Gly-Xaa carboxypeptidase, partial [Tremellales sp. Uapishka_1]
MSLQISGRKLLLLSATVLVTVLYYLPGSRFHGLESRQSTDSISHSRIEHAAKRNSPVTCPTQPEALDIGADWLTATDTGYHPLAYERLAGAIKIRTETFDDMPLNASDPRFDVFYDLEAYLRSSFPLFHNALKFERVNVHGLLFTWDGVNPSLKPMLLMAHQDVVPVNPSTWKLWTHPPFDAYKDEDNWIWGRGTTDMKSTLISLLSATERLLEEGFQPERTVLFSFGFDEEIGGERGAMELSAVLRQRYGHHGISLIVDEGFTGVDTEYDQSFARIGMAEKGCFSVKISVATPGGHSSVPPHHTGIGIMSRLIVEMENNPSKLSLNAGNPLLGYLECVAEHGHMEESFKDKVRETESWPDLVDQMSTDRTMAAFMGTTQAVDIINGGIKYNALPELVTSITNYRIDFLDSSTQVLDSLIKLLRPVVESMNMTFSALGSHPDLDTNVVKLDVFGRILEPAPITPDNGPAFELMAGTIKHLFPGTVVAPSGMIAFTDTQHYWDVSTHIYRFVPASLNQVKNYHTVNERIHFDAHLSTVRFFYKLLHNSAGWKSE